MIRRFGFFFLTNILIIVTLGIVTNLLGVASYINESGLDYQSLAVFSIIWGFAGSFFSLAISRWAAKAMHGVKVITPERPGELGWLVNSVHQMSKNAGLPAMPEVGVYDSPEVNAFATGPSRSRSLVAVSTGLLHQMNRSEVEGVLAHEVAHIQNGDMVTMTLLQGVVNAFIIFFARVISFFATQFVKEENRAMVSMILTIVLEIALGILGMLIVNYFSRQREFRADASSARLAGRHNMIAALQALQRIYGMPREADASLAPFKISGKSGASIFSTHPSLESRIEALQKFAG
jgi:heat shock protein HtpX